jgi:hypothetical protein
MQQEIHTFINWLGRAEIDELLEMHGYCVNGDEFTNELRELLRQDVMDGVIILDQFC